MNTQQIIAQHRKAVALSFYRFGQNMPVNEDTLAIMIVSYGQPFLQELEKQINMVNYATPEIPIFSPNDPVIVQSPLGIINTGGDQMVKNINDFLPGGIYYNLTAPVTGQVEPTPVPPAPPVFAYEPEPKMLPAAPVPPATLQGNGGMLPLPMDSAMLPPEVVIAQASGSQAPAPAGPAVNDQKNFWEKYKTAIIIVAIVLVILVMMNRRSTPVIIK